MLCSSDLCKHKESIGDTYRPEQPAVVLRLLGFVLGTVQRYQHLLQGCAKQSGGSWYFVHK